MRGSPMMIASSASAQPGAAVGLALRIRTASPATAGSSDQRYSSAAPRPSRAAACRNARSADSVCARQKPGLAGQPAAAPISETLAGPSNKPSSTAVISACARLLAPNLS